MSDPGPLRLLLYTPVVPTETGGVQAVYRRTAEALAARGHAVVRAWPIEDPQSPEEARCGPSGPWPGPGEVRSLRLPRLEDRRFPLGPVRLTPRGLLHAAEPLRRLAGVLRGFAPDAVDVHFPRGGTRWLQRARRLPGVQPFGLVLTCHGSDLLRPLAHDQPRLPGILAAADRLIVVSGDLERRAAAWGGNDRFAEATEEPVRVRIENGIDGAFWARPADAAPAGADAIACVGRLEPVKGHDVLLRALADVRRRGRPARLTLVGDGPEEAELRRLATDLEIGDAVRFAGRLTAPETRAVLHASSVFALPSRSEGLPLALLEALAAGLPTVASAVGGVADVLTAAPGDPAGETVPPDDPAALADALCAVLGDEVRRVAAAEAAVRRAARFDASASDARHAEVLEAAAGRWERS